MDRKAIERIISIERLEPYIKHHSDNYHRKGLLDWSDDIFRFDDVIEKRKGIIQ